MWNIFQLTFGTKAKNNKSVLSFIKLYDDMMLMHCTLLLSFLKDSTFFSFGDLLNLFKLKIKKQLDHSCLNLNLNTNLKGYQSA